MSTSLHDLAYQGNTLILLQRIKQGADVNELDEEGMTPLHYAVLHRREKAVRLLLEHGADIHACGSDAGSVLQSAAWIGSLETMQLLLDYGAANDPADVQRALRNCFYDNGHRKAPLLLAAGAKMGLVEAIHKGDLELVRSFLNEGANADDCGEDYTPLMHEISSDWPTIKMIDLLIDAGADVNRINSTNETALTLALGWSNREVALHLLQRGADVNLAVDTGETPLMRAIVRFPEFVTELIKQWADVNAHDKSGKTPLILAREEERPDLIEQLIRAGANE